MKHLFIVNPVAGGKDRREYVAEQARREGVNDLRRSGLLKVKQGLTSLDEVLGSTNQ